MKINKGPKEKNPIQPLTQFLELKSSATHRQEFFKFPPDIFDCRQPSLTPPACS